MYQNLAKKNSTYPNFVRYVNTIESQCRWLSSINDEGVKLHPSLLSGSQSSLILDDGNHFCGCLCRFLKMNK